MPEPNGQNLRHWAYTARSNGIASASPSSTPSHFFQLIVRGDMFSVSL